VTGITETTGNKNVVEHNGERVIPGVSSKRVLDDHYARYQFVTEHISIFGKSVLDVACGTGYGSMHLANQGAAEVLGVDLSWQAIEYARTHYSHPKLRFVIGDATNLALAGGYFDIIVSFETLEHIKNQEGLLRETYRVLKANGSIFISTPNRTITSPYTRVPNNPHHTQEFTLEEFLALLQSYYSRVKLLGQHVIPRQYTNIVVRKLISLVTKVSIRFGGPDLKRELYALAGGPDVVKFSRKQSVPRYIVAVCQK
jgi:ubiquinone biosynthesis O-methyltransferase